MSLSSKSLYISHQNRSIITENCTVSIFKQDAREAMRVVFFYTHKTYLYAQNEISYGYIQVLF